MRINILPNEETEKKLLAEYNVFVDEVNEKYNLKGDDAISHCEKVTDDLIPYSKITKAKNPKYKVLVDDEDMDFTGVYIVELGSEHSLFHLTEYETVLTIATDANKEYIAYCNTPHNKRPAKVPVYLQAHWFGICDNATQILKYFETQDNDVKEYLESHDHIILMTPIFREDQPCGGWRASKWGPYIGVYDKPFEYIKDEPNLDYVFVWSIIEVMPKTEDGDD